MCRKPIAAVPQIVTVFIFVFSFHITALAKEQDKGGAVSSKDLKLFCSNEQIWSQYSIPENQCLEASRQCLKETSGIDENAAQATQRLYNCIFEKLHIQMPQQ